MIYSRGIAIPKDILVELYNENKLSMFEIAEELDCSLHKVAYWMNVYKIARRGRKEANYLKYNPDGDPFILDDNLSEQQTKLKFLGLGLYWGEGGKTNMQQVRLGNSDPDLMIVYCRFLREVCRMREEKIHFHLQVFKDQSIKAAKEFWAKRLRISSDRITSSKPMPSVGKGTYKRSSKYGVLTVGVYNTHFRKYIFDELRKLGYGKS